MKQYKFFDEVHDYQRFVIENIKLLGNYIVISEQFYIKNTKLGIIDILALDIDEKRLVALELKNEFTTDKNIWQPIRYFDLLSRAEDSLKDLLSKINLDINIEEVNLNPKVSFVIQSYDNQLSRSLSYVTEIDIDIVLFRKFYENNMIKIERKIFTPNSIFHKEDLSEVKGKIKTSWDFDKYKDVGINNIKLSIAEKIIKSLKLHLKDIDVFYYENKITITKNNKVWCHLFIKRKPFDYKLVVSFSVKDVDVINLRDFSYNDCIESFDVKKRSIKIELKDNMDFYLIQKLC